MGRLIDADRVCQGNCTECHDCDICNIYNAPTVEAIPKDQYEARLKADKVAMLTEIQMEIEEMKSYESPDGQDLVMLADIGILFQEKIDKLKGVER